MKKLLSCVLVVCLCMVLFAACGGNQNTDKPGNTGTTTEPNQEATQETTQEATQETTQSGSNGSGSGPDFEINFDDLLPKK